MPVLLRPDADFVAKMYGSFLSLEETLMKHFRTDDVLKLLCEEGVVETLVKEYNSEIMEILLISSGSGEVVYQGPVDSLYILQENPNSSSKFKFSQSQSSQINSNFRNNTPQSQPLSQTAKRMKTDDKNGGFFAAEDFTIDLANNISTAATSIPTPTEFSTFSSALPQALSLPLPHYDDQNTISGIKNSVSDFQFTKSFPTDCNLNHPTSSSLTTFTAMPPSTPVPTSTSTVPLSNKLNSTVKSNPTELFLCMVCGDDISDRSLHDRQRHMNECLDNYENSLFTDNNSNKMNTSSSGNPANGNTSNSKTNKENCTKPIMSIDNTNNSNCNSKTNVINPSMNKNVISLLDSDSDSEDQIEFIYHPINTTIDNHSHNTHNSNKSHHNNSHISNNSSNNSNKNSHSKSHHFSIASDTTLSTELNETIENETVDCIICGANLVLLSDIERNNHVLECINDSVLYSNNSNSSGNNSGFGGGNSSDNSSILHFTQNNEWLGTQINTAAVPTSKTSANGINNNINIRTDNINSTSGSSSKSNNSSDSGSKDQQPRGLLFPHFYCVICDINLSRRFLFNRCQHLKYCAKQHKISTKELLSLLCTENNNGSSGMGAGAALFGEQEDGTAADFEEQEEDFCEEQQLRLRHGITSNDSGNVDNSSARNNKSDSAIISSNSSSSAGISRGNNAFSKMMKSSAQLTKGNGFNDSTTITKNNSKSNKKEGNNSLNITVNTTVSDNLAGGAAAHSTGSAHTTTTTNSNNSSNGSKKNVWGNGFGNKRKSSSAANDGPPTGNFTPAYKKIQIGSMSMPIVVDGFQYASKILSDCYFLTHFHSDHYMGLESDFCYGNIYCSPTTAALVRLKLKITGPHLIPFELEKKYVIMVGGAKVEVTFMDANHCPGAVCILFEFENGKQVFHTGDFRWCNDLVRVSPTYKALALTGHTKNMKNLIVYLDTTYCDVSYDFPPQNSVISEVVDCVRREAAIEPKTLFVFGAYTIGKERVFMAAAEELNCKVYVDKTRWKSMLCFDWPLADHARLTTDPTNTSVWVVAMNQINFNQLDVLKKKKNGCTRVVGFQPTGWTHTGATGGWGPKKSTSTDTTTTAAATGGGTKSALTARHKDGNTIYSVSYSEHSSFTEIVDFIRLFRPQRVVPTVNISQDKVKAQLDLLKQASGIYGNNNAANNSGSGSNSSGGGSGGSSAGSGSGSGSGRGCVSGVRNVNSVNSVGGVIGLGVVNGIVEVEEQSEFG